MCHPSRPAPPVPNARFFFWCAERWVTPPPPLPPPRFLFVREVVARHGFAKSEFDGLR